MGSTENIKLCDFTIHNNNDFICTPIAAPATSIPSYETKPALLNLPMKDRFSGAGDDAALHFYLLRWSFVNDKAGGIDNSSVLVGCIVICCCVQVQVK